MTTGSAMKQGRGVRSQGNAIAQFVELWDMDLQSSDPLGFTDYQAPASNDESVQAGTLWIGSELVVGIEIDFSRAAGTMGVVAGERIVRAYDRATSQGLNVVQFVSSGGARLQEGMFSLVQMARTVSALHRHRSHGLISVAILRSPTTGGVYASWASLSDVRAAVRNSVIGFGGPRVVEQVTGIRPGADSHSAEAAYASGLVDSVIDEGAEYDWLAGVLASGPAPVLSLPVGRPQHPDVSAVPEGTWNTVCRARAEERPSGLEWAAWLTDSWVDLGGADRCIRAGLATVDGRRVMVIAMDRHAGETGQLLPGPSAFRFAQRALSLADQISVPVLTIVDTPGADPGPDSETGGIAGEIARTLFGLAGLRTESVCLVVGEGGSGGAMSLAHCDVLLMLEGAVFSVISPESGAAVLYRDASKAPQLARDFRMSAREIHATALADHVVAESIDEVRQAVSKSFADAIHGNRNCRIDSATQAALVSDLT